MIGILNAFNIFKIFSRVFAYKSLLLCMPVLHILVHKTDWSTQCLKYKNLQH